MTDPAALQALLDPLFPGLMGVRLTALAPDRVVADMVVRPDLCTAGGILHGGWVPPNLASIQHSPL